MLSAPRFWKAPTLRTGPVSEPPPAPPVSWLDAPERAPLRPPEAARTLGRTVVVAPHADDESLACGGLLALLARQGVEAHVVVVTDGAASHPGSAMFPPARLAAVREAESRAAVRLHRRFVLQRAKPACARTNHAIAL